MQADGANITWSCKDEPMGCKTAWELFSIRHPEEGQTLLIRFGKKEPEIKQTPAPQEVKGAAVEELDPEACE